MTKIATLLVAVVAIVMMVGGCGLVSGSGSAATIPAEMTLSQSSPLLQALDKANAADQAARGAQAALEACGSCDEGKRGMLRDALNRAQATCTEAREDYLATVGNNQDDPTIALYPKQLDESFTNPNTHLPFTCGM